MPHHEVNSPAHYTDHPDGIECIQITRYMNFAIGNAVKYLWRAGLKPYSGKSQRDARITDLKKAVWYIQDEIKLLEGDDNENQQDLFSAQDLFDAQNAITESQGTAPISDGGIQRYDDKLPDLGVTREYAAVYGNCAYCGRSYKTGIHAECPADV